LAHNAPTRMLSVTRELFRATFPHYSRVPKTAADLNVGFNVSMGWTGFGSALDISINLSISHLFVKHKQPGQWHQFHRTPRQKSLHWQEPT